MSAAAGAARLPSVANFAVGAGGFKGRRPLCCTSSGGSALSLKVRRPPDGRLVGTPRAYVKWIASKPSSSFADRRIEPVRAEAGRAAGGGTTASSGSWSARQPSTPSEFWLPLKRRRPPPARASPCSRKAAVKMPWSVAARAFVAFASARSSFAVGGRCCSSAMGGPPPTPAAPPPTPCPQVTCQYPVALGNRTVTYTATPHNWAGCHHTTRRCDLGSSEVIPFSGRLHMRERLPCGLVLRSDAHLQGVDVPVGVKPRRIGRSCPAADASNRCGRPFRSVILV